MATLTSRLLKRIGYVPNVEVRSQVEARVKELGIDQKDRPEYRAMFLRGMPIPPAKKATEYLTAYKGWVYTCVNAIAEETANIKLVLKKRLTQYEFEIVDTHPALDLLHNVNPLYTSYLLWQSTEAYLDLIGEAFWWMAGAKADGSEPKEIWILRPDWVKVKDTKDKLIDSYSYGPPGEKKVTIPFNEIIHFKDLNPLNPYRGYGTVLPSAVAIDTDDFSAKYNRKFFYNDASPGGVIKTDQNLTDDAFQRIRTEWENVHKGAEKSWKVAILEAGLEWQDVGLKQKDMQFIEQRKFSRDEILSMFRVPKPIVAISDDVNRASASEARAVFLENNIDHKMRRLVTFLNEFYLPRFGKDADLFFDYISPIPSNEEDENKAIASGMTHGWMTRNEAREMKGLETIQDPSADMLLIPQNLVPLSEGAVVTEGMKKMIAKKRLSHFNVRIPPVSKQKHDQLIAYRRVEEKARDLITLLMTRKALAKREIEEGEIITDQREKLWKSVIKRTDPRETSFRKILSDLFHGQKGRVLDAIDQDLQRAFKAKEITKTELDAIMAGKSPVGAVIKAKVDDVFDITKENDIFFDPLMKYVKDMIESEGIIQIQELVSSAVFYLQTDEIKKYLRKEGGKFITAINEATRSKLQEQLALAIEAQESIPQIKARVDSVYGEALGRRSETIARTEVTRATNFATEQAYLQSDVVEAKEWLTSRDERVCPWCGPMDGKIVDLGRSFYNKGDKITGKTDDGKPISMTVGLSDVDSPPLHPNCRCTLIPVLVSNKTAPKLDGPKLTEAKYQEIENKVKEIEQRAHSEAVEILEKANDDAQKLVDAVDVESKKSDAEKLIKDAEEEAKRIVEDAKVEAESKKADILKEAVELREELRNGLYKNE